MEELNIGKKIQQLRMMKNLSVRRVAANAGITPSMLSQIENEQVNPSINTLRAVAQVLDTPLYCLFTTEEAESIIVKPEQRRMIAFKGKAEVQYELLTPDTRGDIEFCMMVIPPQSNSSQISRSHDGEEVAYVCSGEGVTLEVEGNLYPMVPGDSVRIPAKSKHNWHNQCDTPVEVVFAVSPPSF